jgi:hypothetical protein
LIRRVRRQVFKPLLIFKLRHNFTNLSLSPTSTFHTDFIHPKLPSHLFSIIHYPHTHIIHHHKSIIMPATNIVTTDLSWAVREPLLHHLPPHPIH